MTMLPGPIKEEVDFLNEISALNNEMANTQRCLVKQNMEVIRLNKQLKEVNSNLEQFTYVASHDLKEPLRMITAFMELLKKKYGESLDEKANSYINFAIDGGFRMHNMINDLLEFSRTGDNTAAKKAANLETIVNEVKMILAKQIEDTDAKILLNSTLPVIKVNKSELSRVFQNLLSNAIKFCKKGQSPVIQINSMEMEHDWLFTIEDNGIGIDSEKFGTVFEVFTRLHLRSEYEGTGIGLAICKKIIERHGGKIWITSEKFVGSIFHFTLPKS